MTSTHRCCAATCLAAVIALNLAAAVCADTDVNGWGKFTDPDGNCQIALAGGQLQISVPGPAHDLSAELNRMNAPRILREVEGDFVVEVQIDGPFLPGDQTIRQRTAYTGAGLLLMKDDKTYIRLERAALARNGRASHYANFEARVDGKVARLGRADDRRLMDEKPVWLRLERNGDKLLGAVRQKDDGPWQPLAPKTAKLPAKLKLGVAAVNVSTAAFSPIFSKLKVTAKGK